MVYGRPRHIHHFSGVPPAFLDMACAAPSDNKAGITFRIGDVTLGYFLFILTSYRFRVRIIMRDACKADGSDQQLICYFNCRA